MREEHAIMIHMARAIGYRFSKVAKNSGAGFGDFRIDGHVRTPREIVNHMRDLVAKTRTMITEGHFDCPPPALLGFREEADQFMAALKELENAIPRFDLDQKMAFKLLQGPMVDMATHIGQLAMLSGLHGNKIPKENYFAADL